MFSGQCVGFIYDRFNKNFYLGATGWVLLLFARLLVGILLTSGDGKLS